MHRAVHRYGHVCYSVHPLRSELREEEIAAFVDAVHSGKFDCIFFTSALPAKIIAPRLKTFPRVIAIGPQTAKELEQHNVTCETLDSFYSKDFVPYLGEWVKRKAHRHPACGRPEPGAARCDHSGRGNSPRVPVLRTRTDG